MAARVGLVERAGTGCGVAQGASVHWRICNTELLLSWGWKLVTLNLPNL